ncbi:hypothetical protein [Streptomyces sp. R41]|uniref:DUF402 domain-containing protein n=1 Tax=Streptomyces sp. R41 TaxID=3238632 RepID=A0AB39RA72_9ACTN
MIEFRGRLEERPDPVGWEHRRDCASATRGELLWYFFPGDVSIRVDSNCWETNLGWVPLLHFSLSLADIYTTLGVAGDTDAKYYFTESDAEIRFHRSGEMVTISPSFGDFQGSCRLSEFRQAIGRFLYDVIEDIGARFSSVLETPLAAEISEKAEFLLR